jgi:hypothetical protein
VLLLTRENVASPRNKFREHGRQWLLGTRTAAFAARDSLLSFISSHPSQKAGELTLDFRLTHRLAVNVPSDWYTATTAGSSTCSRSKDACKCLGHSSEMWHWLCLYLESWNTNIPLKLSAHLCNLLLLRLDHI